MSQINMIMSVVYCVPGLCLFSLSRLPLGKITVTGSHLYISVCIVYIPCLSIVSWMTSIFNYTITFPEDHVNVVNVMMDGWMCLESCVVSQCTYFH